MWVFIAAATGSVTKNVKLGVSPSRQGRNHRSITAAFGIIWQDLKGKCYSKAQHMVEKSLKLLFLKINNELSILI